MLIDLIYKGLREAVIRSYTNGNKDGPSDLDNEHNQMEMSLSLLERKYDPKKFTGENIKVERIRLLTDIQTEVDSLVSKKMYMDLENE